jgi:DNA-binding MarR family transcriptional regulator
MGYFDRIYADENVPQRAKLVYFYLCDRMDKTRIAWPGIKRIGADLAISRSTVKRAITDLEKAGYIRKEAAFRENCGRTSNRYHIL